MTTLTEGATLRQIGALFDRGGVAGEGDGALLDRFLARRDPLAFEALVERHGPMVLSVCRGTLRDPGDVEDAFQATFLVLVRKAGSIRGGDAIGPWLHRVAHRVAVRANIDARRRHDRERKLGEVRAARREPREELRAALHEEIDRLPERLRRPLVLCHLEDRTHAQAAFELRLGEATVRRRLAGARDLLRSRLARRGIVPAALFAGSLAAESATAALPASWSAVAVRAAMAATFPGGIVPPAASALSRRVARSILASRLKAYAGWAAAGLVACGSLGLLIADARPVAAPEAVRTPAPAAVPAAAGALVEFRGRVVDPAGRPVVGAVLRVDEFLWRVEKAADQPRATSGADGRFDLGVPRETVAMFAEGRRRRPVRVMATAPGFGAGWADLAEGVAVTIRLTADDMPIEGRVLDLEGRPVAGAVLHAESLLAPPGGDMTPWIEAMKAHPRSPHEGMDEMPFDARVTTGPDGRFRLGGVGRERLISFTVAGPGIAVTRGFAFTKDAPALSGTNHHVIAPETLIYHGARFDYVAAPSKPVAGVLRDEETGRPLAGVKLNGMPFDEKTQAFYSEVVSVTDGQGRYRLDGMPKADQYRIFASPGEGQPYPTAMFVEPATSRGLEPATIDLKLRRGVLVRGRLTDKSTGEPVQGRVEALAFRDNPDAKLYPNFRGYNPMVWTRVDGRFEVATIPGPGFLAARASSECYLQGIGAESIRGMNPQTPFSALPGFTGAYNFHVLAPIDPPAGAESAVCDLQVDPGKTVKGTIVDSEGKPLSGVVAAGLQAPGFSDRPLESASFQATGVDPRRPRRVDFFQRDRGLAGSLVLRDDENGPVVVKLRPWGLITGRVVDDEGRPRTHLELTSLGEPDFNPRRGVLWKQPPVDRDGRFRITVIPGLGYKAYASTENRIVGVIFEEIEVAPGEVRDLGDVRATSKD